jgi:hypothetical protein
MASCCDPAVAGAAADPAGVNAGRPLARMALVTRTPQILCPPVNDHDGDDGPGMRHVITGPHQAAQPMRAPDGC